MSLVAAVLLTTVTSLGSQELDPETSAWEALHRGEMAKAERLFHEATLSSPDEVEALLGWATALLEQGRALEASARIRSVVARWLRRDDLEPAAAALGFLAESSLDDAGLQVQHGEILVRLRRFEAAENPLQRALEARPDSRTALLLGSVAWENGDDERAAELFRRVGESPSSSRAVAAAGWVQLGRLELWRSRPEYALSAFEQAQALGGDSLELQVEQARALAQLAETSAAATKEALRAHEDLVLRIPENPQARYRFARLLARAGETEESRAEMRRYRELDQLDREETRSSGLTAARAAAAREYLEADRPELALKAIEGEGSALVELRSLALMRLGRFREAQSTLESALQSEPTRTELRALLARAIARQ